MKEKPTEIKHCRDVYLNHLKDKAQTVEYIEKAKETEELFKEVYDAE